MTDNVHVPEHVLSRIWEEQQFFPDCLYTTTGQPVQVIRPGVLNRDAGPDFKAALIRIGDHTVEGDVELHLHLHDWKGHGHHTDPHYNQTVLHVVLWPPERPTLAATAVHKANGDSLPTIFVHHVLNQALTDLIPRFRQADEHKDRKRHRCQVQLHAVPEDKLLATLQRLGRDRLHARAQRFYTDILNHPPIADDAKFEQALYEALCEGLGYAANKAPFRQLARRLPLHAIMGHLPPVQGETPAKQLHWIQALLFGTAGFLQQPAAAADSEAEPDTAAYHGRLQSLWEMLKPTIDVVPMSPEDWQFFRLRPANFPTRRIAALSHLVLDYTVQPVFSHYLELFNFCVNHPGEEAKQIRLFEGTLQLPISDYWQTRYKFGPPAKATQGRQFLGQSRIRDILISAVFPAYLCYAQERGHADLEAEILRLYQRFPSPAWAHATQALAAQLLDGHDIAPRKLKTSAMYQGLLHLSKTSCSLPACTGCPIMDLGAASPDF